MARAEWGPKGVPLENRVLMGLDSLKSAQLKDYRSQITKYLKIHPGSIVEQAILSLARSEEHISRIDLGLHVLNQLAIVNRGPEDVVSVRVSQDMNSSFIQEVAGVRHKLHHYYYAIDWIHEPDKIVEQPQPAPQPADEKPAVIYPFKTAAQRIEERRGYRKQEGEELARMEAEI